MKLKKLIASLVLCVTVLTLALPAAAATSSFGDVTDPDTAVNADVLRLMGVVSGSGDNRFSPAANLTRAEFSVMAVKVMGRGNDVPIHTTRTIFSDVTARHWARGYINLAASIPVGGAKEDQVGGRLISGDGTGRFNPDSPITYAQAVTILMRMLGYTDSQVGAVWPAGYLNLASSLGLTRGLNVGASSPITRGQAARLFVNLLSTRTEDGRIYCTTLGNAQEDVMLLAVNVTGDDGRPGAVRTSKGVFHPAAGAVIPTALQGMRGTLVLNGRQQLVTFVPDGSTAVTVTLSGDAQAAYLKAADGTRYAVTSSTPAFTGKADGPSSWGELWMDLRSGAQVTLFMDGGKVIGVYYPSGGVTSTQAYVVTGSLNSGSFHQLTGGVTNYTIKKDNEPIKLSDIQKYDVVTYDSVSNTLLVSDLRMSIVYEQAYPNLATPETITVLGHTFPVLECALDSISQFKPGDSVNILITADGKIAGMVAPSYQSRSTAVGIAGSSGVTVELPNGGQLQFKGKVPETVQDKLVTVNASKGSYLSAMALGGGSIPGDFDLVNMTLGEYKVAAGVKLYEQVGSSAVVPISLADLEMELLPENRISLYRTNTSDMVDIIVINAVTGDAYTYGILREGSVEHGSGDLMAKNTTVSVENSGAGYPAVITGTSFKDGGFGGVVAGQREIAGTRVAAGVVELTGISGVKRSDFFEKDGVWYVNARGTVYEVSDRVEGYKSLTRSWVVPEDGNIVFQMRTYSNDMTVYVDPVGHKVRIITAT